MDIKRMRLLINISINNTSKCGLLDLIEFNMLMI